MRDLLARYRRLEELNFLAFNCDDYDFIAREKIPGDRSVGQLGYDDATKQFCVIQRGRAVTVGRGGRVPLEKDPYKIIMWLSESEAEKIINVLEKGLKK